MPAVPPSGASHIPSSPFEEGRKDPRDDKDTTKIESATKGAFARSDLSAERKKIEASSYGDYAYIEIDKGPTDWLDIVDKSIASIKEVLHSLPQAFSDLLKKIHANLKKLWSAVIGPALAGMAMVGHTALKTLPLTGARAALLGLVALTKLFVFLTEICSQQDAGRAKEKLKGALKLLALTLMIECDSRVLKGDYEYFKEIFTGVDPKVALETLQRVKRLVSEALLSEWDLALSPIKNDRANPVKPINSYPTHPVKPTDPDEPAV